MHTVSLFKNVAAIAAFGLLLGAAGCIPYWQDVNKLEQENFEMADQLKWQEREQDMKAEKAEKAKEAESADPPPKPSDY